MFNVNQTLAELALTVPDASRVFRKHRLDFCCGGKQSVASACVVKGLDAESVLNEIEAPSNESGHIDWATRPLPELLDHIIASFHEAHRRELPDLVGLAHKVERVHADKPTVPVGLASHLLAMQTGMKEHMQKEELELFPAIRRGTGSDLAMLMQKLESEHDDHGEKLAQLRDIAHDFVPPPDACTSWRALYLRCEQLESDLMAHVHLENHVLFPRAREISGSQAALPAHQTLLRSAPNTLVSVRRMRHGIQ